MTWIFLGGLCAFLYGLKFTHDPVSAARTTLKTSATLCLCLAGVMLDAPLVIVVGLLLGAVGDAFLSREHSFGFLPGLAAFLFGHLVYLFWAIGQVSSVSLDLAQGFMIAVLIMCTISLIKRWWGALGALKLPVLLYVVVSISLAATAIVLLDQGAGTQFVFGVVLFVMSDIILAEQQFVLVDKDAKFRRYSTLLWGLYWLGQLGILLGSLSYAA